MLNSTLTICKSDLVRTTCRNVMENSHHVKINSGSLVTFALEIEANHKQYADFFQFDCHLGKEASDLALLSYLFILDTLNFCFWPKEGYEYDNLAKSLKKLVIQNNEALSPQELLKWSKDDLKNPLFEGEDFPLIDERIRLIHETAQITINHFDGCYANILKRANKSSQKLLDILTTLFTGFQDHAIYNGAQVFFYKRSQILIADIYAAYQGKGYGQFDDIEKLTMFPDYRVPQILNHFKVLEYSQQLIDLIAEKQVLQHGSEMEVEIRAGTVIAVENIKDILKMKAIEIDWILWQQGEKQKEHMVNHHRTLSIFY